MPFSVLLVCTGNTCRSAMAEGILRSMIPEERAGSVAVSSAGTLRFEGAPAADLAREVSLAHGIDIGGHLSRGVDEELLETADLILAMTRGHADFVASVDPEAAARTFLLSEFAEGADVGVPDPMGGTREDYEHAFSMIEGYLKKALPAILDMAREGRR